MASKTKLAVVATEFQKTSETFIRDHVRVTQPGGTLIIGQRTDGVEPALPSLSGLDLGAFPLAGEPRQSLGRLHRIWRRYLRPVLPRRDLDRLVAFLRAQAPKAVMAEYGPTGAMVAPAAQLAEVPLFVHFHGFDATVIPRLPGWASRYRRLFQTAAGVIGPSAFITDKLRDLGCPSEKLHVSACGIDPDRFVAGTKEPGRLLAVGRLVNKKGPHLTIEAFGRVARDFPHAHLDLIGGGPLAEKCAGLVAKYDLESQVTLHGPQPHKRVAELMGRASIFLQHSLTTWMGETEGLPVSVLEAMASEVPVIATRHSGIAEAVHDGVTGFLVEERDVDGMATAIRNLLANPEIGDPLGPAARARVLAHYTHARMGANLRRIMGLN
ncbi:MAG: glycosyltransferase [Pseudomonadota bacterium]